MPLVGVVDPSHTERASDEPGRLPGWLPADKLLESALTGNPKWSPWPYEMVSAAVEAHQERDYISVTMLTGGCGRGKVLERREEYVADLDSMYASLRGTQIHRTLEHASRPGSIAEWRFFATTKVHGQEVELSCSPDVVIYEGEPGIWDWKVTENPPTFGYPWKGHTRQLQYNRWLVNNAAQWVDADQADDNLPFNPWETKFEHLAVVYLGPKGPKVIECMKSKEVKTPNDKVIKRKMPDIWTDEAVAEDMMPRLEAMVMALDAYPKWPFDGEMCEVPGFEGPRGWACPGKPWCSLPNCLSKRYPAGLVW